MASSTTLVSGSRRKSGMSRVVRKRKGPKGRRLTSLEWEDVLTCESEDLWDCYTDSDSDSHINPDRKPPIQSEAEVGWDCHGAEFEKNDWRDSGYVSYSGTPPESLTEGPSFPTSPEAIRYQQLPFKTKHYFLTYLQRILEATCLGYAREKLSGYLTDLEWKKRNLKFRSREYPDDRMVYMDWLAEDGIELEKWVRMFAKCFSSLLKGPYNHIFESAMDLRNVAVHRDDREGLSFEELTLAMKLPAVFGDSKHEAQVTNALRYIVEDPTLDDATRASVESAMYTPPLCTSHYRLLGRIQTMLEETCFNHAARKIPHILTQNGWEIPEQIELQNWYDVFRTANIRHDHDADMYFPDLEDCSLLIHLSGARDGIRNVVAHRSPLLGEDVVKQVHGAVKICVMQGDWRQAVEIEILAEMYFTGRSRWQVLRRLEDVFRSGSVGSLYERERRIAIARVLASEEGREVSAGDGVVVSDYSGACFVGVLGSSAYCTESPSMHECLKRVVVLE